MSSELESSLLIHPSTFHKRVSIFLDNFSFTLLPEASFLGRDQRYLAKHPRAAPSDATHTTKPDMSSSDSNEPQTLTGANDAALPGGLDAMHDSAENKQIAPRQREQQEQQEQQVTTQSGSQSAHGGAPAVRLDMDLDIEVELKAKIKGDVTLSILGGKNNNR